MPETNISSSDYGEVTGSETLYTVPSDTTDGPSDSKETEYINNDWSKWLGYYKEIPELRAAIDAKATWTVGKGFIADPMIELLLSQIRGWGKDTFNTILENLIRTYHISGDSYAEIIKDKEDRLLNIKPLDPGSIKIIADGKGIIKRYEQVSKIQGKKNKKYNAEDIFHLARNRVADEIHGVSLIPALEPIILARNEAMADMRTLMRRHVKPVRIWHLDTDDITEIATFKEKVRKANDDGEDHFVPKGAVEQEIAAIPPNATLNPLPWIDNLNQYFFQATGVPDIIVGSSKNLTEASSKIAYLAFQQTIEEEQLFIEEEVLNQLGMEINLEFPASLENEMLSDKPKAEESEIENESAVEPNDTTAEVEGNK